MTDLKDVADIVIAVGGVVITVFGWLSAQTAKSSAEGIQERTADGLNKQLELVLEPMNRHVDAITDMAGDVKAVVQQVAQLDVLTRDVRSDVLAIRRDLNI